MPESERRGARTITAEKVPALQAATARRWALIVGISKYEHGALDLQWARRDAEELARVLQDPPAGVFEPGCVETLFDEQATKAHVTRALRRFLPRPEKDDILVIYFACHGAPDPDLPDHLYLLTHDTDPRDIPCTALPMRELQFALREYVRAQWVVVVADACRAGGLAGKIGRRGTEAEMNSAVTAYLQQTSRVRKGTTLLLAAEASQSSQEDAKWGGGHGVFTHHLLEGLRGKADGAGHHPRDGMVTVRELYDYVRKRVEEDTRGAQCPWMNPDAFNDQLPLTVTGGVAAAEHEQIGWTIYDLGWQLDDVRRFASAAAQFREAARLSGLSGSRRPRALLGLGLSEMATGRLSEAVRAFEDAVAKGDDGVDADARYHLGVARAKQGDLEGARQALDGFLERHPDDGRVPWVEELRAAMPERRGRRLALLIGIGEYADAGLDLEGPPNDLASMQKLLHETYGFGKDDVRTLPDEAATREGILRALGDLERTAGRDDLVLFYFSGSSMSGRYFSGAAESDAFLLAHDFAVEDGDPRGFVGAQELHAQISAIPALRKIAFFDIGESSRRMLDSTRRDPGYLMLMSASPGQSSHELFIAERPQGVFTHALVQSLARLRHLSLPELIVASTKRQIERYQQFRQTPCFEGPPHRPLLSWEHEYMLSLIDFAARQRHDQLRLEEIRLLHGLVPRSALAAFPELASSFGRAYLNQGAYDEAIEALRAPAEQEQPPGEAIVTLGRAQALSGLYVDAVMTLRRWCSADAARSARLGETMDLLELRSRAGKRALLVGIDTYVRDYIKPLGGAVNDVDVLRRALVERCGFEEPDIQVLQNERATRTAILDAFRKLAESARQGPAVFFFAGYGSFADRERNNLTLVSADGRTEGVFDIELDELAASAGRTTTNLLTILDAGWNSLHQSHEHRTLRADERPRPGVRGVLAEEETRERTVLPRAIGRIAIYQGSAKTVSNEDGYTSEALRPPLPTEEQGRMHGLLTHALVDALYAHEPADLTYGRWADAAAAKPDPWKPYVTPERRSGELVFSNAVLGEQIAERLERIQHEPLRATLLPVRRLAEQRADFAAEAHLHLGLIQAVVGEHEAAVESLQTAIRAGHGHPEVQYYLGRELLRCNKLEAAVDSLKAATSRDPQNILAFYWLGEAIRALIEQENLVEARKAFETYLDAGAPAGHEDEVQQILARWQSRDLAG